MPPSRSWRTAEGPYGSRRTGSEDHLRLPGLGGLPVAASPGPKEPLKHGFQGYWSRRINDEHRLIHKVTDDSILIAQCRYHYEN
ncbi:Txe/YoeB family addiction module toxin [Streptomyces sp. GP55]|uniref:Txe/YoeB family addiction module toxin n=1 Tax=Kitasatospora sp. GP30 TaxID=3035084 RepID=UPI000C6FD018